MDIDHLVGAYVEAVYQEGILPLPNDGEMTREELIACIEARTAARRSVHNAAVAVADACVDSVQVVRKPDVVDHFGGEDVTISWVHDLVDPDTRVTDLCVYMFDGLGAYSGAIWLCDPRQITEPEDWLSRDLLTTLSQTLGWFIAEARGDGKPDIVGLLRHLKSPHTNLHISKADGPLATAYYAEQS